MAALDSSHDIEKGIFLGVLPSQYVILAVLALSHGYPVACPPHPDAIPSDQPCRLPGMSKSPFLPCPLHMLNESSSQGRTWIRGD